MSKNLKSRIERLESRSNKFIIIYYRGDKETFEQRKQRFFEEEGYELPSHAILICYRRLDIKNKAISEGA